VLITDDNGHANVQDLHLSQSTASGDLLLDSRTAFARRLKHFAGAEVFAFARSSTVSACNESHVEMTKFGLQNDHIDRRLISGPDECIAKIAVLLESEGVGYSWLIVAEQGDLFGKYFD
jgi:hypothetical protein